MSFDKHLKGFFSGRLGVAFLLAAIAGCSAPRIHVVITPNGVVIGFATGPEFVAAATKVCDDCPGFGDRIGGASQPRAHSFREGAAEAIDIHRRLEHVARELREWRGHSYLPNVSAFCGECQTERSEGGQSSAATPC